MEYIKKGVFIRELSGMSSKAVLEDIMKTALTHGWIEKHDIDEADELLVRLDAARITHMFLRKECGWADLPDISGASVLRDLYDCRVCVNHIAQVYLRGLMDSRNIPGVSTNGFRIFAGRERLTADEAEMIYRGIGCVNEKEE